MAQYDSRYAKLPFYEFFNEIIACVSFKNYAIVAMPFETSDNQVKETPVGYVLWGEFNQLTLALYAKGIRQLAVPEFKSGEDRWVLQLCTPFGFQTELLDFIKLSLPQLFKNDKMMVLDLLEKVPFHRDERNKKA
jgi:hemolysin-activating ACP:hemolysin acyltransferase